MKEKQYVKETVYLLNEGLESSSAIGWTASVLATNSMRLSRLEREQPGAAAMGEQSLCHSEQAEFAGDGELRFSA
ncbi:hypothetical protein [Paenibacillus thiaminolyticus]|uniref:hypothetical protein n=1 Tax=Paenibacillus thiaminolyticus TaxID=49283 RepID=UPI0025436A20|nr:hypothetical protein [Paenibacillus thiaminolyticus]WII37327.1 hypothetical protein O0V01_27730 [Paenibacillus thiaminolyticus]